MSGLSVAAEICEDLWIADSPDIEHSMAGATLIVNLSASDEVIGKGQYRKMLVTGVSAKTVSAYIYADAGEGESSTDLVFGAQNLIAENGLLLAEGKLFEPGITYAEIDIQHLIHDRQRMNTFDAHAVREGYLHIPVSMKREETDLSDRFIDPHPFVPADKKRRHERCEEIFEIQSRGLSKRLQHIGTKTAVIGVSGGLDSTLALLVTARAYDLLGLDHANIQAVTMPAFGTTDRTRGNACLMAEALGTTLKEIPVGEAVNLHFRDIGHDPEVRDVTYETARHASARRFSWILQIRKAALSSEQATCPRWRWAGARTTGTTCQCMQSMSEFRRHWCAISSSTARMRQKTKHSAGHCWMYLQLLSPRNSFLRRETARSRRRQRTWSARTSCTTSSFITVFAGLGAGQNSAACRGGVRRPQCIGRRGG